MSAPLPRGLGALTAAKVAVNTALRSPYVFLTPISRHLDTSVGHLGFLLGLAELTGLATAFVGRSLDRGRYRFWMSAAAMTVGVGALLMAALHSPLGFAAGFGLVALGVALYTTAGHSWLGRDVGYAIRGRAMGLFETSWALALLIGVPIVGVLLSQRAWWLPFLLLGVLSMFAAWLVRTRVPDRVLAAGRDAPNVPSGLTRRAQLTLLSSFTITFAAVSVFSVYGSWLQDRFGLSTRVLGAFSIAIGFAELAGSAAAARFSDVWGKPTAVRRGVSVMMVGLVGIVLRPPTVVIGVAVLVVVFVGFEFGLISLLSVVSEVGGERAGAVVAIDHAFGTVSRAGAAALAATLYEAHGIVPPVVIALVGASTCAASISRSLRPLRQEMMPSHP